MSRQAEGLAETPKQYGARRVRVKLERAKVAVMEAQQEFSEYGEASDASILSLADAAFRRLDQAWLIAMSIELEERAVAAARHSRAVSRSDAIRKSLERDA